MSDTPKELLANIAPFGLRMQAELKDEIKRSAEKSGRSMNAEIVHRLERSLQWDEDGQSEANALIETLERKLNEALEVNQYLESIRKILEERLGMVEEKDNLPHMTAPQTQTLYVVLDAQGFPTSWQEISLHLGEIGRAGNFEIDGIEARIFDAKLVPNSLRERRFWELFERYRAERGGQPNDELGEG